MQWSPQQDKALALVDDWYKNHRHEKQVFYLAGVAGTGKTTLAMHFAQGIEGKVNFSAYTGKAAHVMAQKGCTGAQTIHRLIYRPKVASKDHLKRLQKQLADMKSAASTPEEVAKLEKEIEAEKQNVGRMSFSLNLESDLRFAKLLIVDEVSMIDKFVGKDLESFGVPILVLGDPEQLPPIRGQGYFTEKDPDFMLTEIHRQALDNPIILMAKKIREGGELPLGAYGDSRVVSAKLSGEEILQHDIILTGLRDTKRICDVRVRQLYGRKEKIPLTGDRVMCLRNDYNMDLLNGQQFIVQSDALRVQDGLVSLHVKDPDTNQEIAVTANEKLFHGEPLQKWEREEDIQEFEYAYAITVHKAQGSQWDNVLLFDQKDRFGFSPRDKQRWLYTGITRAAKNVTVVRL